MTNDTGRKSALGSLRLLKRGVTASAGLIRYLLTGRSALSARMALLDLHCRTNGRSDEWISPLVRTLRPPRRPTHVSGVLGEFSVAKQTNIADAIARDGFYLFDAKVPAEICDDIEQFAKCTPMLIHDSDESEGQRMIYDPIQPASKRYRMSELDSITNRGIQRLVGDPVFLRIAERYLGTLPLLSNIGVWLSPASEVLLDQDAAQNFHFDFDAPPFWLKLFVYLTDVGPDNGPHVFVRGSHRPGNPATGRLLGRGYARISDQDINGAFGSDNVISIQGKRGTVFFADTRGFHKGLAPITGLRLVTQFLYGPPHFNDWIDDTKPGKYALPLDIHPVLAAAIAANPRVYRRYQ